MLKILSFLLYFLLLSLTVNLSFILLSEELLVFFSSLLFVALLVASLRKAMRLYFFQRAYQVLLVFLALLRSSTWLLLQLRCCLVLLFHWEQMLSLSIPLRNLAFNAIALLLLARKNPGSAAPLTLSFGGKRQKLLPLLSALTLVYDV